MTEISVLVQATVVLVVALIAARAARRAPAAVRALLLASTFAVLLLLPLAAVTVPKRPIEVSMSMTDAAALMPAFADAVSMLEPVGRSEEAANEGGQRLQIQTPSPSTVLRTAWVLGLLVFAARLMIALMRLRLLRRRELPWLEGGTLVEAIAAQTGVSRSVSLFLHEDLHAPVTYGLFRPAIGLPIDAPEWPARELRHALIHELEHVRRGDWVVQLLARGACAIYWLHPLAWMAWRRLCVECERACDDAVLRGAERTAYAEQLVSLARRLKSSPAPLLSMADPSHLATRVGAVLDVAQARGPVGAATAALIVTGALGLTAAISPLQAVQAASNESQPLPAAPGPQASTVLPDTFEVVSIRRNRSTDPARGRVEPGGRFTAVNLPVIQIIRQAYGVRPFQVLNAPDWTATERFDIIAKAPDGAAFGVDRVAPFLRSLLRDRFGFSARIESQEMPIYTLVASRPDRKPGAGLEASAVDCSGPAPARPAGDQSDKPVCALIGTMTGANNRRYEMRGYPMSRFAEMLGGALDRLVVDRTGLTGTWNVELNFAGDAVNPAPDDLPPIFTALQEQLALALEPARGPVDMLVIARIERPTED